MMDTMDNVNNIPQDMFTLVQENEKISDVKLSTKPVGYLKDAWNRFRKNRASVVALVIILLIALFAIITPLCSKFKMSDANGYYAKSRPKLDSMSNTNSGFWDGTYTLEQPDNGLVYYWGIALGALDKNGKGNVAWDDAADYELNPVRKILSESEQQIGSGRKTQHYQKLRIDSYYEVGFLYVEGITPEEYQNILNWQAQTGKQVLYPIIDEWNTDAFDEFNRGTVIGANMWYAHDSRQNPLDESGRIMTLEQVKKNGLTPNYLKTRKVDESGHDVVDENGEYVYETAYYTKVGSSENYKIRVLYYNYYQYVNGHTPSHTFGADAQGYDIIIRLAKGVGLSLILAVCVSIINLTVGAIYGAIEGYYGGAVDMVMERITDVLSGIPFIVLTSLFKLHFVDTGKTSAIGGLLFVFVLTGWIGTAYSVRMQFYRFKGQEYILAARTLGAKDIRLMFRHILPNSLGTLITSSVLVIPGVIFSETSLAYLGIINFNGMDMTSLGTMLYNGQNAGIDRFPHIIFFPALIISLLMISFNLFGNGLRDAFNPSLRGSED